jgi:ribonuclease G
MNQEILINVTPYEARTALLENGVLQELFLERQSNSGLVGNIYKGKVSRVLPGMQAAFIEIGLERSAFLHASDIVHLDVDDESAYSQQSHDIRNLLNEGSDILVQVTKDPMGTKGARLTTYITLPSRFVVYLPKGNSVGISNRIKDEEERERLSIAMQDMLENEEGGFIVRTAAEGASLSALRADIMYLRKQWQIIAERSLHSGSKELVHKDLDLALRSVRDLLNDGTERIRIDDIQAYEDTKKFMQDFMPSRAVILEHYQSPRPIFDLYNVEEDISKALDKKVFLKSGGYLIIDQTEAMTTIDVNTGAFVGYRSLEETIFKTNLEAAQSIAHQLRLRNLGGIIILDFIDMESASHREQVVTVLKASLELDYAKTQISELTSLGLIEMTRKRTRESLGHVLCATCPTCEGRGSVRSPETVCYEVFREVIRQNKQFDSKEILILASPVVIDQLLDEESTSLGELEGNINKPIRLQVESLYKPDQYDVVPL